MLGRGTQARWPARTMATWTERVTGAAGRAEALRRIAAAPHAPAVAGALLAVLAAAQAIAQPAIKPGASKATTLQIAFVLLALFTTLPLGLLWAYPAAAAVAVCAAMRAVPLGLSRADRGGPDRRAGCSCTGSVAAARSCWPRASRCRSWCWR